MQALELLLNRSSQPRLQAPAPQGQALENRVHSCLEEALLELEKHKDTFDPTEHINFIVGNLITGLCFGEQYV